MMLETTITDINGSLFVRIPANMADYFGIKGRDKARIQDINEKEAKINFIV